eukprot:GHVR01043402.1.p1 GENE.GHVR01043402.1~~GHVR01043402.1.p1  ORF type:complete len:226 (+),score=46.91 GHVR01043402.1:86-763(+)
MTTPIDYYPRGVEHPLSHVVQGGHWNNNDDDLHLFARLYYPHPIRRITFAMTWVDQGWGHNKGGLLISSALPGSPRLDLFGVCDHASSHRTKTLTRYDEGSELLSETGGHLCLYYRVGGGGGHSLRVSDIDVTVELFRWYELRGVVLLIIALRTGRAKGEPLWLSRAIHRRPSLKVVNWETLLNLAGQRQWDPCLVLLMNRLSQMNPIDTLTVSSPVVREILSFL